MTSEILHVLAVAEELLEGLCRVHAAEAAAEHDDVLAVLADIHDVHEATTPRREGQQQDAHEQRRSRGRDEVN